MTDHLPTFELQLKSLLESSTPVPTRAAVEHTLTTGYAHALRLEGERVEAERRLRELIRSGKVTRPQVADAAGELDRLSGELARLRALLSDVRAQAL